MVGLENIGVDDPAGLVERHQNEFEKPAVRVCADDEGPGLAAVVLFGVADGVVQRVEHVLVIDPMLSGALVDHHIVTVLLTEDGVNEVMTMSADA